MKNAIIIAAVAGLASAAAAQTAQLTLTPSTTTVDTSGGQSTFTMELRAVDFDIAFGDDFILNTDGISLQNVGDQGLIDQTPTTPQSNTNPPVPFSPPLDGGVGFQVAELFDDRAGTAGGTGSFPPINNGGWNQNGDEIFQGAGFGWNPFAGPPADANGQSAATANDPLLGTYIVKVQAGSVGTLNFEQFQRDPNLFIISTTNTGFDITEYDVPGDPICFGTATVNLVPAPSALALVGLGGLVAGRRRR